MTENELKNLLAAVTPPDEAPAPQPTPTGLRWQSPWADWVGWKAWSRTPPR